MTQEKKHTVLVVDDIPENIATLAGLLKDTYKVKAAKNGYKAIEIVQSDNPPDLVLLDVMMPGIDGFETCIRMKKRQGFLPVIMVTALTDRDSRIKGIECGADDFLSKPIDPVEVTLKVRNFLAMKSLYDKIADQYEALKELEEMKENLTAFIIHDLKSPLTGAIGYLALLNENEGLDEQSADDAAMALQSVEKTLDMIADLLDVMKLEGEKLTVVPEPCDLKSLVEPAAKSLMPGMKEKLVRFSNRVGDIKVNVQGNFIERVIRNLLSNAVRYTPRRGDITVAAAPASEPGMIVVGIADTGKGVPPEFRKTIFDKFGTVELKSGGSRHSTGLGLTFCRFAVEAHGGRIWVDEREGGGSVFKFTVPAAYMPKA